MVYIIKLFIEIIDSKLFRIVIGISMAIIVMMVMMDEVKKGNESSSQSPHHKKVLEQPHKVSIGLSVSDFIKKLK